MRKVRTVRCEGGPFHGLRLSVFGGGPITLTHRQLTPDRRVIRRRVRYGPREEMARAPRTWEPDQVYVLVEEG